MSNVIQMNRIKRDQERLEGRKARLQLIINKERTHGKGRVFTLTDGRVVECLLVSTFYTISSELVHKIIPVNPMHPKFIKAFDVEKVEEV